MNGFESLAKRFDDVDSLRSLQSAMRQAGLTIRKMIDDKELTNTVLVELAESSRTTDPQLSEFSLKMLWQQFANRFDANAESIDFRQVRGTKYWVKPVGKKKGKYIRKEHVVGYVGESNPKEDWKIIAANYAHVCRLQSTNEVGGNVTQDSGKGLHRWVLLANQCPKRERRERAAYVFSKLDGNEQNKLKAEFAKCTEYRGVKYTTAIAAAIAKIVRKLEAEKA